MNPTVEVPRFVDVGDMCQHLKIGEHKHWAMGPPG